MPSVNLERARQVARNLRRATAWIEEQPHPDRLGVTCQPEQYGRPTAASTPGAVIIVLGYCEFQPDGTHGISAICRAGVRRAETLADDAKPHAVIFTGWSSTGGPTEADLMAEAWNGRRDIPLIRESLATNTAENAVRTLAVVRSLDAVSEAVVVCSIRHFPRVRFLFERPFREHGYTVSYRHVTSPLPAPALVAVELGSITRMVRDRRRARALLDPTGEPGRGILQADTGSTGD
jgi:DUF218 domain